MAKVNYAYDVALLSFQVLGVKPEKGKTPLIWTMYAGIGADPFTAALQVAADHGFAQVNCELPEDIAWRGSKTKLNENGKGGTVFTAEIKIIHSATIAPAAEPQAAADQDITEENTAPQS